VDGPGEWSGRPGVGWTARCGVDSGGDGRGGAGPAPVAMAVAGQRSIHGRGAARAGAHAAPPPGAHPSPSEDRRAAESGPPTRLPHVTAGPPARRPAGPSPGLRRPARPSAPPRASVVVRVRRSRHAGLSSQPVGLSSPTRCGRSRRAAGGADGAGRRRPPAPHVWAFCRWRLVQFSKYVQTRD